MTQPHQGTSIEEEDIRISGERTGSRCVRLFPASFASAPATLLGRLYGSERETLRRYLLGSGRRRTSLGHRSGKVGRRRCRGRRRVRRRRHVPQGDGSGNRLGGPTGLRSRGSDRGNPSGRQEFGRGRESGGTLLRRGNLETLVESGRKRLGRSRDRRSCRSFRDFGRGALGFGGKGSRRLFARDGDRLFDFREALDKVSSGRSELGHLARNLGRRGSDRDGGFGLLPRLRLGHELLPASFERLSPGAVRIQRDAPADGFRRDPLRRLGPRGNFAGVGRLGQFAEKLAVRRCHLETVFFGNAIEKGCGRWVFNEFGSSFLQRRCLTETFFRFVYKSFRGIRPPRHTARRKKSLATLEILLRYLPARSSTGPRNFFAFASSDKLCV